MRFPNRMMIVTDRIITKGAKENVEEKMDIFCSTLYRND